MQPLTLGSGSYTRFCTTGSGVTTRSQDAAAGARRAATVEAQPPQPVVARVFSRTSSVVEQERIRPALTPAQAQTSASSGSRAVAGASEASVRGGISRALGSPGARV